MRYVFSAFVLDTDTRQLVRAGEVLPLSPKAFDFLELLLRERPRAVSVTRLRSVLWPSTHVGATSLHAPASQVRSALADEPRESQWLRTVPRFGYAFCGTATSLDRATPDPADGEAFRVSTADGEFRLRVGDNVLGREAGLAVRIDQPGVSRRHACIRVEGGRGVLTDLGSKNGTFVQGRRVTAPIRLEDGDEVRLGLRASVVFRRSEGEETETEVE
jgi:DNA-binding winged helix-turn-helix (wHTH) protein